MSSQVRAPFPTYALGPGCCPESPKPRAPRSIKGRLSASVDFLRYKLAVTDTVLTYGPIVNS